MKLFELILYTYGVVSIKGNYCHENVCIPSNYDAKNRPTEEVLEIILSLNKIQILRVNDEKGIIDLHIEMELEWREPRLKCPQILPNYLALERSFIEKIWKPDIFVNNLKSYK